MSLNCTDSHRALDPRRLTRENSEARRQDCYIRKNIAFCRREAWIATLKLKVQLYCGDEIALGPGKAELLDHIERAGSISAAAKAMGMSYRRAWLLVDAMNRCFREPLVETHPGGGADRGARLTEAGREAAAAYAALLRRIAAGADGGELALLQDMVRGRPARTSTRPD
jgi:molybdate transport system regulatory protein